LVNIKKTFVLFLKLEITIKKIIRGKVLLNIEYLKEVIKNDK